MLSTDVAISPAYAENTATFPAEILWQATTNTESLENGDVFHTYSTYGRGGYLLIGTYNYLDLSPPGPE